MSKGTINHRYSIEYIHPTSSATSATASTEQKKSGKGLLLIAAFSTLLLTAGFIYSNEKISGYLKSLVSTKLSNTRTDEKTAESMASASGNDAVNVATKVENNSDIKTFTITIDKNKIDHNETKTIVNNVKVNNKSAVNNSKIEQSNISPDEVIVTDKIVTDSNDVKSTLKNTANSQTVSKNNSKQIESSADSTLDTNFSENNALIESLDQLTEQLVSERKKNTGLENKLKENLGKNNSLTELLAKSIKNDKSDNKNYLSALQRQQEENKKIVEPIEVIVSNNKTTNKIPYVSDTKKGVATKRIEDSNTIAVEVNDKTKKNLNYNNAISLSTKSQMDAIILAMQGGIKTSRPSAKAKSEATNSAGLQTQNNDLISQISQQIGESTSDTAAETKQGDFLSVGLKGKINQLIISKQLTSSSYKKALEQESKARSNSVRSIVVKKGETLWGIAKRAYGDGKLYTKILKANPQLTRRRKLFLVIGQVIRVPK